MYVLEMLLGIVSTVYGEEIDGSIPLSFGGLLFHFRSFDNALENSRSCIDCTVHIYGGNIGITNKLLLTKLIYFL